MKELIDEVQASILFISHDLGRDRRDRGRGRRDVRRPTWSSSARSRRCSSTPSTRTRRRSCARPRPGTSRRGRSAPSPARSRTSPGPRPGAASIPGARSLRPVCRSSPPLAPLDRHGPPPGPPQRLPLPRRGGGTAVSGPPLLAATDVREAVPAHPEPPGVREPRPGAVSIHAVDGVSFTIHAGETLGLIGESGSGKTTLGWLWSPGSTSPPPGPIAFEGTDMTHLKGRELLRWRRNVQVVFQDPVGSLDPRLRVWQIVGEPIRAQEARLPSEAAGAGRGAPADRRPAPGLPGPVPARVLRRWPAAALARPGAVASTRSWSCSTSRRARSTWRSRPRSSTGSSSSSRSGGSPTY